MLDLQLVEQRLEPVGPVSAVHRQRLEDREDVLLHRQLAEDRRLLREVADPLASPLVHRHPRDILAVEADDAPVRRDQACDHVERRRLAGAVRSEEPDDLALPQFDRDIIHDVAITVSLHQPLRLEAAPADGEVRRRRRGTADDSGMLTGGAERPVERGRRGTHPGEEWWRELHPGRGRERRVIRVDRAARDQAREDRALEMLPHVVERELPRFDLEVAPFGDHRLQVVGAIRDGDLVERRAAGLVRALGQREEAERGRAVPTREGEHRGGVGSERSALFVAHGRLAVVSDLTVSAFSGSRNIPDALSLTSTFWTSPSSKCTEMTRPRL